MEGTLLFLKWFTTFIRACVRPAVTIILVLITGLLAKMAYDVFMLVVSQKVFDASQILVVLTMVLEFIFAIVVAVIAFWFGTRTQDKKTEPPLEG
jgi:predicted lysophospholipase L1 biosynthesis ABC-type transport system permease subunit